MDFGRTISGEDLVCGGSVMHSDPRLRNLVGVAQEHDELAKKEC